MGQGSSAELGEEAVFHIFILEERDGQVTAKGNTYEQCFGFCFFCFFFFLLFF
jgi:hypothetical protein